MKIDPDYLKKLLEGFESAPNPVTDIRYLKSVGFDYEDNLFIFHIAVLKDQGLIEREGGKPGFGFVRSADGIPTWSVVPLRLTSHGHDFLEALRNKEVWATIKEHFKGGSIGTLVDLSKKLLESYTTKKLAQILEGGT